MYVHRVGGDDLVSGVKSVDKLDVRLFIVLVLAMFNLSVYTGSLMLVC